MIRNRTTHPWLFTWSLFAVAILITKSALTAQRFSKLANTVHEGTKSLNSKQSEQIPNCCYVIRKKFVYST